MTTWKENIRRLVINEGLWVDKELSSIGISDPKTFLIYSPVPWNQGNIERMLSVVLQLRGHKVDEVICGGNFPACGMEHCNVPRPLCENCVKNAVSWFDVWNLKFKSTEDFRLQNDLTEAAEIVNRLNVKQYADMNYKRMCKLTFESLPIGKRIYEQIYWYFSGDVSNKPKVEEYLEKCAISYILTARITRRILERTKYDAVIACNGKTIEVSPLMDVVISSNIRIITWEEMFAFDNNKPVVEYNQDGVWDAIKHKPLTASERTIIENYFERWRKSEITPYKYYTDPITDKQQIMNTLGIREKSFKIVIFPNLINDSTSIGMHRAFDSMFDWVFSCVEYAIEHPDVDLIIRSHPAEKVKLGYWGSRIYVTDAVRNKYRNLSKNVIFVDAESQVSSYTLLELADIAMTYTGTLALEAPLYNKLCVVAGKSHLNFKGFTIDLQTKEQMYELFSGRTPIRRATEEEKQLACQYGYFYRFRVTTKLDFYDKNATSFNIPTIKMLKKGGSIFWDNLCESIINNYAFIDLNQPDRKVVRLDKSISGSVAGNDVLSSRGNTKLWSKKLDSKLNQLPAVQARKINKYLREKSYLNKEIISRCYPAIWDFETTNRCGMQCTHCPRTYLMRRAPIDMDINLFKKIIDECRTYAQNLYPRSKIPVLSFFHYGEPALYRYFEESIKYSKSKGYHVIISSTSCAFNDKAIQAAVESQLDELWLIFDGMDDVTFRKVRGKAASFTKGFAQLRKLFTYMLEKKSHLPEVKAVMIKHPFNRHQWREFNSFFSQNNIKHYLAHFSNFAGRVDKINELESLIADDPDEAKEIQRVSKLNRHICYYPWHSVAVLADGRVVPCCRDVNGDCVLGDLNKESLADIWNGEKIRKLRAGFINGDYNNPLCSNCEEKSLETGVPNQIDRQAESLFMNLFAPTREGHRGKPAAPGVLQALPIEISAECSAEGLKRLKKIAEKNRFGDWQVGFNCLTIYCQDLLSFYMAAKDIFLHRIYDFAAETDRPVVIDGGGHIGLFTLFVKQKYPNAKITIFEPDKKSIELLRKNLQLNSFNDVKIIEAGLYKNNGEVSFNSDNSDGSSIYSKEKNATINVVRLSEYIDCDIDFLKLNIEGAELDVISEAASKLQRVKEVVIEYHGFPEVGQNLHKLLTILEKAGFRYIIHDFDAETNPATKPPFRLNEQTRFFLLIHAKKLFPPTKSQTAVHDFTDKNTSLQPISRLFGFDRGKPIDRYYIENFLNENKHSIRGRVLEIGDNSYTKKYGSAVTQSDILNAVPSPNATIVGDLSTGENIPESAFDCIIMTQTIQCIYDIKSALKNMINALKPGGTLLITASGISQISRYDMDRWGEYWRFTDKSLRMLLAEFVPEESIHVEAHGNVAVAKAFLDGQAMHELDREVLDYNDNDYQVLLTARVCKTSPNTTIDLTSGKGTKTTGTLKTPLILLYHRVANDPIDSQLLAVSPENFEAHLKELVENYTVLPLHQLLEEAGKGQLQPDTLAITLDDGYLDNLTNAVPLLEKYGLHATIFVVSGMVGSQSEFWWDALERIFLTGHPLPELLSIQDSQGILEWGLTTAQDRLKAYDELCGMLRMLPSANIDEIVNQLLTWAGLMRTGRTTHRVVNAQQLKLLASSASVEIGSHSITHTRLSALSPQQQQYEIAESKQQLESIIEKPVRLFSYPYGNLEDITKETGRILAQTVYDAGIANVQGSLVPPVDMYAVPRRLVRNWSGPTFAQWLRDDDKASLGAQTLSDRAERIINSSLLPWSKQKQTIQPQNEACLNNYSPVAPPGVLL